GSIEPEGEPMMAHASVPGRLARRVPVLAGGLLLVAGLLAVVGRPTAAREPARAVEPPKAGAAANPGLNEMVQTINEKLEAGWKGEKITPAPQGHGPALI